MTKLLIFIFAIQSHMSQNDSIFVYEHLFDIWKVYYDHQKEIPIVEIGGVKFGQLDTLYWINDSTAIGKNSFLKKRNNEVVYDNEELNIYVTLELEQYNDEIDWQREKIYSIQAYSHINRLIECYRAVDYLFKWDTKQDYIYYRDSNSHTNDYQPIYLKDFYEYLNNEKQTQ